MSSSTDAAVVRAADAERVVAFGAPRVRGDQWTRLGDGNLRGDEVTEGTFTAVAHTVHEAARAQGYAVGWSTGRRDALAAVQAEAAAEAAVVAEQARIDATRREAEHALAVARLADAADAFAEGLGQAVEYVEQRVAALALAIVTEVLGRDAAVADVELTVRRALQLMPEDGPMTVRVHPQVRAVADELAERKGVTVVADLTLDRTDVVVDLDDRVIDARVGTALAHLKEAWQC